MVRERDIEEAPAFGRKTSGLSSPLDLQIPKEKDWSSQQLTCSGIQGIPTSVLGQLSPLL